MSGTRSSRPAQRWPDVMIGVLTLALLGGFGTLLLGQRKPVETAQPPAAPVAIPASPGTVPEPVTVTPKADPAPAAQPAADKAAPAPVQSATTAPNSQTTTPPAAATTTPKSNSDQAATATAPATTDKPLAQTTEIPPAPKAPEVKPITPPVIPKAPVQAAPATPAQPATATTPTPAAPATAPAQTPAIPATPAVPPRAGGAVATSANRTPLRSDYRISLGSFSTNATVTSQTASVNSLGYRVHAIDLGDQYVAQVGPFADEASARQALADIQRAYPGALLYRPKAKASETATASSDTNTSTQSSTGSAASTSAANTTASTPAPAAQRSAPSGPTYLQVGAFDRVESAQNLVGTLKDVGFAPTVNNPPDRKTTVMVGPYSGDALLRAEARLDNAGLDHFRVR